MMPVFFSPGLRAPEIAIQYAIIFFVQIFSVLLLNTPVIKRYSLKDGSTLKTQNIFQKGIL